MCKNLYNLCNDLGKTIHGFQTGLLTMWLGLLTLNFRSPKGSLKFFLGSSLDIYILYSVRNCILKQGSSTRLAFAIWMIPTRSPFCCYHIFLYSLAVLCLDAYVNLIFMSCKTELSLINHLVLSCLEFDKSSSLFQPIS